MWFFCCALTTFLSVHQNLPIPHAVPLLPSPAPPTVPHTARVTHTSRVTHTVPPIPPTPPCPRPAEWRALLLAASDCDWVGQELLVNEWTATTAAGCCSLCVLCAARSIVRVVAADTELREREKEGTGEQRENKERSVQSRCTEMKFEDVNVAVGW